MPKKYLTVKEVARLLGVTPLTVRNWDARGKLSAHRHPLNNYRVYRRDDIERLLTEIDQSKNAPRQPRTPARSGPKKLSVKHLDN